ncbi:MAG: Flp pilus assembly complex ATPase component TadA [Candidatus Cloacimonetes bacterium]|nr:Flp pilus assembly complex ATPase component TadA [Candidatus Cloacimonadota bacterium]
MALTKTSYLEMNLTDSLVGVDLCHRIEQWLDKNPESVMEGHKLMRSWLLRMIEATASDLDFGGPGSKQMIWMRIYGIKSPNPDFGTYAPWETNLIILSWLTPLQKKRLYQDLSIDFSVSIREMGTTTRYRGTVYFENNYLSANFRRINSSLYSMSNLGIPKPIAERMNLNYEKTGLVLVTGITGSGKSTTLDAIIDMNNRDNQAHIVIIGHPIEFVHESKMALVKHREVGVDVQSFKHGAIESLRQDPDIIMIGEMRDPDTIATVLEITDSGHKVFTTLHTSSAIDSIHRIIAEFPSEEQERIRNRLADVLKVSISQKLVPSVDNKLILAKEIMSVDSSIQAAIRNKNIGEIYQMMVEGKRFGMMTLEQDLLDLYKHGFITNKTAINYANNKKRITQLLSMPGV